MELLEDPQERTHWQFPELNPGGFDDGNLGENLEYLGES